LATDVGEQRDVADKHPDIVRRIAAVMLREHTPSEVFPVKVLDDPGHRPGSAGRGDGRVSGFARLPAREADEETGARRRLQR